MSKFAALAVLLPCLAMAGSGADLLLNETGGADTTAPQTLVRKVHLDDPFLVLLYGNWKAKGNLPFEVSSWLDLVFEKKFEEASHLISTVKAKAPEDFLLSVEATELYLYWRLGLPQTFFDHWLDLSVDKKFLSLPLGVALDQVIGSNASGWFMEKGIRLTPDQKQKLTLIKEDRSKFTLSARAWAALRTGAQAEENLLSLSEGDPLRFHLAQSIVLDHARSRKMKGAAQFLKKVIEPAVASSDNFEELVKYHLLLARLLYQTGALDASAHYYELVPKKSRFFLEARVERLWILLRKGDMGRLKGELVSLDLDLFDETFLPEVYLVSSIAHLKLCQFQEVKSAFDRFVSIQKHWRKVIQKNLSGETPDVVDAADPYLRFTDHALKAQGEELTRLEALASKSIEAVVPSVGVQPHWEEARNRLLRTEQLTKKDRTAELKRRWTNKLKIQDEAIRKMRFVKVELLGLLHRLARESREGGQGDQVTTYKAALRRSNELEFPYDGLAWGDEVFNLSAQVRSSCLSRSGQ